MDKKLYNLAELIKLMATDVSKEKAFWQNESISDAIGLFESDLYFNEIKVTDDKKCRCITIGDTRGAISRVNGRKIEKEEHKGYMLLYSDTHHKGFPSVEEICERLKRITDRVVLTGTSTWYEKKSQEALDYYARVVIEHAEVLARIGRTPQEIFASCQ